MSRREREDTDMVPRSKLCKYESGSKYEEDGYFDEEDGMVSQGSIDSNEQRQRVPVEDVDEIDPLDAFMNDLDQEFKQQTVEQARKQENVDALYSSHDSMAHIEEEPEEDLMESFVKHRATQLANENKNVQLSSSYVDETEYDLDDNPILKKKVIDILPPLDHSLIEYEHFERNFYKEHESVSALSEQDIINQRNNMDIKISGLDVPRPVSSFAQMGLNPAVLKLIKQQGFTDPTPIQKQAITIALSGRDIIGIAKTGSGKTIAFILPMLIHLMDQRELALGEGPIAIIVAPTRELAQQIYTEARKFSKCYGMHVAPAMGGIGRGEMRKMLKAQPYEIVVATPGRLIELFKNKLISTQRVTFLVLDEADKFFDMGFEPQVRSIIGHIRPDRQVLLFSATFRPAIEQLAFEILVNPVNITIGQLGSANEDITQVVEILDNDEQKWPWLVKRINDFVLDGSVLIFAGSKQHVEELNHKIKNTLNIASVALHGDRIQDERTSMMHAFKQGTIKIMVATDIAARGLDVKTIKTVVNYYSPRDIDSHIHRIGRTGRAGDKQGIAYSLLTRNESYFASLLLPTLESSNQDIPPELVELATQNPKFRYHGRRFPKDGHNSRGSGKGRQPWDSRSSNNSTIVNRPIHASTHQGKHIYPQGDMYNQPPHKIASRYPHKGQEPTEGCEPTKPPKPTQTFIRSREEYTTLALEERSKPPKRELYNPFGYYNATSEPQQQ